MAEGTRPERVAEEFREILAEEIPRLKDPRVGFVTVTRVEVSPDLRRATVFYTVFGQDRARAPGAFEVHARAGVPGGRRAGAGGTGHRPPAGDRAGAPPPGGPRMTD